MNEKFKIGEKVLISSPRDMYDCDGEIIGETKCCWRVKLTNHKTMDILWSEQKEKIKLFNKNNNLDRGSSKYIHVGGILIMSKLVNKSE